MDISNRCQIDCHTTTKAAPQGEVMKKPYASRNSNVTLKAQQADSLLERQH